MAVVGVGTSKKIHSPPGYHRSEIYTGNHRIMLEKWQDFLRSFSYFW